jgi:AmmeMemoRadiSam system protein B/AmmeMemoRadiSam system protein A
MKIMMTLMGILAFLPLPFLFAAEQGRVRQSALAGRWYPADKGQLTKEIDGYLASAKKVELDGKIVGLICPHAGYMYSGSAAAVGYSLIKGKPIKRVIILAPSHYAAFHGASIMDVDFFRTPLGDVPLDKEAIKKLRKNDLFGDYPNAQTEEHSIEIQLPFLQRTLKSFELIPVLVSDLSGVEYSELADVLKPFIDDSTLVIASSDFTHQGPRFGYVPYKTDKENKIPELDHKAFSYIKKLDQKGFNSFVDESGATICGAKPIGVLIYLMSGTEVADLDYYTSGNITNDWDNSVSYFSIAFFKSEHKSKSKGDSGEGIGNEKTGIDSGKTNKEVKKEVKNMSDELTKDEQKTALRLARDTLELWISKRKIPEDVEKNYDITKTLNDNRGVFVTLNMGGDLRGCIGYVTGREPLFKGIMDNAVNASTYDPRFSPVEKDELDSIEIEISVMTPMVKAESVDEIKVGVHGLMMKNGMRSGLLLPQVPVEWGWNRQEFLEHTCQKAGMNSNCWKDPNTIIYKFTAQVFGEK